MSPNQLIYRTAAKAASKQFCLPSNFLNNQLASRASCFNSCGGALNETCVAQDARSRFIPNGVNAFDGIYVVATQQLLKQDALDPLSNIAI